MHCELTAVVQVSALAQRSTGVHNGQVSTASSWRYVPDAHDVHCELAAVVQVKGETQWLTGVQALH